MKKKLPWLKYDIKKAEFLKLEDEEKHFKEQMEKADKIWQDLKAPVEYVSRSKGSGSVIFFINWNSTSYYPSIIYLLF
jgi:hypothetical protein